MPIRFASVILSVFLFPVIGSATTYIVKPDGTGDFPTIQAAIDAAVDDDIIRLTDGVFTGQGNRDIDYMGKAITIESQSGDVSSCVIDCLQMGRGFIFQNEENINSRLIGITVMNGYAGGDYPDNAGGALSFKGFSFPRINNCRFSGNLAVMGGGAYCADGAAPLFEECLFINNVSYDSGEGMGGGLCCIDSNALLSNCVFEENICNGVYGGAVFCLRSSCSFSDCQFLRNNCPSVGGALVVVEEPSPSVTRCIFTENQALKGGAAAIISSLTTFSVCSFIGNSATWGGAVIPHLDGSLSILWSCTLYDNKAAYGGGLCCSFGGSAILRQTIVAFSGEGVAIYDLSSPAPTLLCCDLYGNVGGDWVGFISDQLGISGNISEDPLFCDPLAGDLHLEEASPCAPFSPPNVDCDLIGAWPIGCDTPTATRKTTWSRIKAAYR